MFRDKRIALLERTVRWRAVRRTSASCRRMSPRRCRSPRRSNCVPGRCALLPASGRCAAIRTSAGAGPPTTCHPSLPAQAAMLRHAAGVRQRRRTADSTRPCSSEPEENDESPRDAFPGGDECVRRGLTRAPRFLGVPRRCRGCSRTIAHDAPTKHGLECFFGAVFERTKLVVRYLDTRWTFVTAVYGAGQAASFWPVRCSPRTWCLRWVRCVTRCAPRESPGARPHEPHVRRRQARSSARSASASR